MTVAAEFRAIGVSLDGREVLRDVSFEIPAGRRTAFVGPNGGGKTTLARVLLGILEADQGDVAFKDASGHVVERPHIGYLPQRSGLSADAPLSAIDVVALALDPSPGFRRSAGVRRAAAEALGRAGLPAERFDLPVGRLSGGQRQRVLLARALAGEPAILLLDEPDAALDADGLKALRRIVGEEVSAGRTVVYVTHDSAAMGGADVVFRIDRTATREAEEPS